MQLSMYIPCHTRHHHPLKEKSQVNYTKPLPQIIWKKSWGSWGSGSFS